MIAAWCEDLLALPQEVWIAYAHSREPLRGKVSRTAYAEFYRKAAACGRQEAQRLRAELGSLSCQEIAARLGVAVEHLRLPQHHGLVTFACYYEPDRIEVYTDNAQATQSLLEAAGVAPRLGHVDVCEMLLAHELFHAVQQRRPQLYINQKHVLLWAVGRWRHESRLVSLEEVAAMAFAQELLGMPVCPYVYDVWMLLPGAPDQARALYARLMQWNEEESANASDVIG